MSHVELPATKKRKTAKSSELPAKKPKPRKMAKKAKAAPKKAKESRSTEASQSLQADDRRAVSDSPCTRF